MNLNSIINKTEWAAGYMIKEITHIIKSFDKRDPGSKGEKDACEYMAEVLEKDCGCEDVKVESFKVRPKAFYGWAIFSASFVLAAILSFFFLPVLSLVFVVAGFAAVILEFGIYKKVLDPFFKEKTSHNVTAIKKCKGETKRRIIFNGHPDAVWEWPVNYALGGVCFEGSLAMVIVAALFYAALSVYYIIQHGIGFGVADVNDTVVKIGLYGLIFVPFTIALYFIVNYRRVVDGANDNLSGCYIGISILKALRDEGIELENTEIGVVLTGSEECGLRGSKAWCEMHKGEFDDVPTVFYAYDTIHDPKYLMANYRDLNGTVKADKELCDLFVSSAKEIDVPCKKGWVPPMGGACDSAAFTQAGYRAAGITGLNHKIERYYHTRLDSYDYMNNEGLGNCFAASIKVLEAFDNGILD